MAEMDFRKQLASMQPLVGTFIKTPSYIVTEVLSQSDLDVVCLDCEHAPFGRLELDQCIQTLRAGAMPTLVRIPTHAPEHILNALDCGATGIVVPHVTSAEEAAAIVKASHFGAGGRGYAGSTRAAGYTTKTMADHLSASRKATTVVVQIEDLEALENLDSIAAVEGVDCLFVGRIDLTVALGAQSPAAPEVIAAVERICRAGADAGRPVGMFVSNLEEVPAWQSLGASLFLLSSDHGFLFSGANSLANSFRAGGT